MQGHNEFWSPELTAALLLSFVDTSFISTVAILAVNPSYEGQTSDQPGVAGRDVI